MKVVLMTSRSGSSLVCRILAAHGLTWKDGTRDPSQSGGPDSAGYRTFEHPGWKATLKKTSPSGKWPLGYLVPVTDERLAIVQEYYEKGKNAQVDFVKSGVEFAGLWMALSDALDLDFRFIKVRRPVPQIAASIARRGIGDATLAAEVARRRFALMDNIPGPDVESHTLVSRGLWRMSGIREALIECGVEPDHLLIRQQVEPGKFHE